MFVQQRIEELVKRFEFIKDFKDVFNSIQYFVVDIKKQIVDYEVFFFVQVLVFVFLFIISIESLIVIEVFVLFVDDFDGFEDEFSSFIKIVMSMEDFNKDCGFVFFVYELVDLKESEEFYIIIFVWFEEKFIVQEKFGEMDDFVLLVKDFVDWREKFDKVGMDFVMKGVCNFEKCEKVKKVKMKSKIKMVKVKLMLMQKNGKLVVLIFKLQFGKDGKMLSQEELNEMFKEFLDKQQLENENQQEVKELVFEDLVEKKEEGGYDELQRRVLKIYVLFSCFGGLYGWMEFWLGGVNCKEDMYKC